MVLIPKMELVYFNLATAIGSVTRFPLEASFAGGGQKVVGIFSYRNDGIGVTPDGKNVIGSSEALAITVTIASKSGLVCADVPYTDFYRPANGGVWYTVCPFEIDLSRSFIRATADLGVADLSAMMAFAYQDQ